MCLPPAANLATAARGVDLDACPPVFRRAPRCPGRAPSPGGRGHGVVEAREADVVRPAVADDPHAAMHGSVGHRQQQGYPVGGHQGSPSSRPSTVLSATTRSRWAAIPASSRSWVPPRSPSTASGSRWRRRVQRAGCARGRHSRRRRVRYPGRIRRCPRTASSTKPGRGLRCFCGPRRSGQVAAVNGRCSRWRWRPCMRSPNHSGRQLDVGRFAATEHAQENSTTA